MRKNYFFLALVVLLFGSMTTVSAQVSNDNEDGVNKVDSRFAKDFVPGQVLVKFKDASPINVRRAAGKFQSVDKQSVNDVLKEFGIDKMEKVLPNEKPDRQLRKAKAYNGQFVQEHDLSQLYLVETDEEHAPQTMQLADKLKDLNEVEFAEPNYKMYLMDTEIACTFDGNPFVTQQWYLDAYGVKHLWNKPIVNPKRPVIAIIDTGVDLTHPDIAPNLWTNQAEADGEAGYDNDGNGFKGDVHGWDFINNTPDIKDFNMHGTHVAGIAAAANNGIGIIGANPQALIMPVSVMQSDGTGDVATIIKGVDYAVANGATVLNLSLGTYANSRALRQALEKAYQMAVIVAAAGNDGLGIYPECSQLSGTMFPAAYSFVLGVQATTNTGALARFSNYDCDGPNYSSVSTLQDPDGFNYEMHAPGTNMLSTIPGGKYKVLNGTSMASPLVAGAISALKMVKEYDSQEILWGDLLHTNNIAEAFAVTARPAELDMLNIQMRNRKDLADETEEDYSGDHEIDAGEIVSIYPVIRTTFGEASNIKLKLEMGDEFEDPNTVEIQTGRVDFGLHLDAYGKGVSLNPLVMKVANNVADNRHIKMKIVATCDESTQTFEWPFTIVVTNMVKINGLISEDMTLTYDHVYLVNDNLGIMKGATLTIEAGTRLEFFSGKKINSWGKLVAKGTPQKPIIFTGHNGANWGGIISHSSQDAIDGNQYDSAAGNYIYTNEDSTLFTLKQTILTPKKIERSTTYLYYDVTKEPGPYRLFSLSDYIDDYNSDMTARQELLTDPNYITPAVLKMFEDYNNHISRYSTVPTSERTNYERVYVEYCGWSIYTNPRDTINYCKLDGFTFDNSHNYIYYPYMFNCELKPSGGTNLYGFSGKFNNITGIGESNRNFNINSLSLAKFSNIVNNIYNTDASYLLRYSYLNCSNYFNNFSKYGIDGKYYSLAIGAGAGAPEVDKSGNPSYLGTSREEIIRPFLYEMGNAPDTYGKIDLSNMPDRPYAEAHGIVWKVCVNGKDAQDEYEDLAPLGVGKHKFEVYFNRPMNKAVAPQIAFGVRDPYTQNAVAEDGSWNKEGTIYTAYKTITGKTKSDGVNRIYVWGAEDNEYFEIPYEKTRFNVMINAAGSMATGFVAEAKLGRVELTWNNEENNFDDAMGFNVYRFTIDDKGNADTICINKEIVDIETTAFTDYDVKPGETYYYMYKVLSTDLKEYDISNVVAATPLTATLGDANGSGDVDVADVITTVNQITGMEPKPFIFEAADMNVDQIIDVIDVIGIIQKILNPSAEARAKVDATATYTIEDGTLYVESPVGLAGVQVQISLTPDPSPVGEGRIKVAADLDGFEHTSAWLSDNDYLFLAYNMNGKTLSPGKHALLHIGDALIASMRLSDANGHNIEVVGDEATKVNRMASDVMNVPGIYDLKGRKLTGDSTQEGKLPKGVYIINGKKVVK